MNKSLYRKVVLIILLISLGLLVMIATSVGALEVLKNIGQMKALELLGNIVRNTYISSVLCSIIAVIMIYIVQVQYSKRMLKKDFRCNEIIEDLYRNITEVVSVLKEAPERQSWDEKEEYDEKRKKDAVRYLEYYKKHKGILDIASYALYYYNNDILIESVQSCFLINLNFKLLSIINNIKNRLPNLRKNHPEIQHLYEEYKTTGDMETLMSLGNMIPSYIVDLRFMAIYWKKLLDYLGYDPTYIQLFIQIYNDNYNIEDDLKLPKEVQDMKIKAVHRKVKKSILLYKLKHFWDD